MLRASVPVAAVDEDGKAAACKHHVRPHAPSGDMETEIDSISESGRVESTAETQFRTSVTTAVGSHSSRGS
jgi:hypothetical protein